MTRWIIFAEGDAPASFEPLGQLRPPCLLRNGAWTIAERWIQLLRPAVVTVAVRPELATLVGDQTDWKVNNLPDGSPDDVWLITGAASPVRDARWEKSAFASRFVWRDGHDAVIRLDAQAWGALRNRLSQWVIAGGAGSIPSMGENPAVEKGPIASATGLWDLVNRLNEQLEFDWETWRAIHGQGAGLGSIHHESAVVLQPDGVWTGRGVQIGPHTVIDARSGPVILDEGVMIEPFTRLDGPAYVGPRTVLTGGKITGGCAFGPGCKLGGEIEASIFQGFANKVHEGFLGHSFVGEWVNLGALTTNSDLKNNYGRVRVKQGGQTVDTGCLKAGSYLSDHTKTAIGTLLPTGSSTGVGVNLLGGLAPKSVPPFVWGSDGAFVEHRLDQMIETARIAIKRRGHVLKSVGRADLLTGGEESAIRNLFSISAPIRASFLRDMANPAGQRAADT